MNTIRYELGDDGIATITHDAPGAPVNTMTEQWQADLAEAVSRVEADKERIKGVLVASAKKTFFAGAQLEQRAQAQGRGCGARASRASRR